MTNETIFKSQDFAIPIKRKNEDFLQHQKGVFDIFNSNLDSFNGRLQEKVQAIRPKIEILANSILDSIESFLNGDTIAAYKLLETGVNQIKKHLLIKEGITDIPSINEPEQFYRARYGSDILFTREEMFHIPFEKRYLVNSQRYSLPGIPCLYLANSTYLCWEELGKPDFDRTQFSRFDLKDSKLKFLNLNHTNQALSFIGFDKDGDVDEMADFLIVQFLATWPLQAAVSNVVQHRDFPFKPEYIIPQLLLQWIVNNKELDGIRFFSTKYNGSIPVLHFGNFSNLVIPIKKSKASGYCDELKQKVKLTTPVSYMFASLVLPQVTSEKLSQEEMKITMRPITVELSQDLKAPYENTKFGQIERILQQIESKQIE
ncbi:hypothetical protein L0U88_19545 [Flavihumibacter sp. RY-1]|uniref:RES domain-containing protein n=1 Tax=Flavihumibacter fluminis TaxID=2909236 RepID=A0ABS9BQF2_9BACT|nr:hypothetical protein [Flavihumibacter fluminis]MCF1716846.1 hypothetical protein [Flavihumibacter fluminis]